MRCNRRRPNLPRNQTRIHVHHHNSLVGPLATIRQFWHRSPPPSNPKQTDLLLCSCPTNCGVRPWLQRDLRTHAHRCPQCLVGRASPKLPNRRRSFGVHCLFAVPGSVEPSTSPRKSPQLNVSVGHCTVK